MTKPTEGPYAATTRQGSWDWVIYRRDDPKIEICQMFHDGTEFNETGEANARLLAKSWEMRQMLARLTLWQQNIKNVAPVELDGCIATMKDARALLASIDGDSQ